MSRSRPARSVSSRVSAGSVESSSRGSPSTETAKISSVSVRITDSAYPSMADLVTSRNSSFSLSSLVTSRFHWLSIYLLSSWALKPREDMAIRVIPLRAEYELMVPLISRAATIRGTTTSTILARILTYGYTFAY